MRIDGNLGALGGLQSEATSRTPAKGRMERSHSEPQDVTEFSSDGISISELSARVMAVPEVRSERVEALRQQISGGTYQPDPAKIASAMIDNMLLR